MAADGEAEQNALLRGIIASVVAGSGTELPQGAGGTESVAQLIAAAMTQLGQNIVSLQEATETEGYTDDIHREQVSELEEHKVAMDDISVNPSVAGFEQEESVVGVASSQVEEKPKSSGKSRPICVKLPIETRKRIIAMRKEGRKCKDIAKELNVSVSGAEKVWERFLATGKVHDRKPSEYAGRPRKSILYAQGNASGSPVSTTHHIHIGDTVSTSQCDEIEYTTVSEGISDPPSTAEDHVVISGDNEIFVGGPLDMPGATVEIVESEPISVVSPSQRRPVVKKKPEYREQLLLRLVEGCPLSVLKESSPASNPHVANLSTSISGPLYMESVLGHPFGRVPPSKPFDANLKEAEVILADPVNPVGKDLIAALGYSTKVFFNACCTPSPLFDRDKVISSLPLCFEAGYLTDSTHKVLQLFLDLCKDPPTALERLPEGDGPALTAKSSDGQVVTKKSPAPAKLSEYWSNLYKCASLLECCENFLSAYPPSAPCLLCHPFQKLAQTLEIKDQEEGEFLQSSLPLHATTPPESSLTHTPADDHAADSLTHQVKAADSLTHQVKAADSLTHQVEVQVLESGQVAMSAAAMTFDPTTESAPPVVAKDSLSSLKDKTAEAPPTVSSSQLKRALLSSGRRRPSVGSCSTRPGPDGQVEVDGQFDMPIPDPSSSGVATTGSNTVMTFVTTSVGLTQTVTSEERQFCSDSVPPQRHSPPSSSSELSGEQRAAETSPTPVSGREDQEKTKASMDAATQTLNGKVRSEAHDRTPLIIRRSRLGKSQKQITKQQQTLNASGSDADASLELGTKNGNETGTPAHQDVHVQTQTPSDEVEDMAAPVQVKEAITNSLPSPRTPRRSKRKTVHGESPKSEAAVASKPPPSRSSPRKVPALSTEDTSSSITPSPRIRTRSSVKRCALEDQLEKTNIPPAKRTRKMALERSVDEREAPHPQSWGVEEVANYISSIQRDCTDVFREHEVDGESLFSLDPEMMVKLMNIKTGPALKIYRKINTLKQQYGTFPSSN